MVSRRVGEVFRNQKHLVSSQTHGRIGGFPPMTDASVASTRIRFWGTRGSIAVPGPGTLRYGGNTTCVELRADGEIIVLDAGSGIRPFGIALQKEFQARPIKL